MIDALRNTLPVSQNKSDFEEKPNFSQLHDFSSLPVAQNGASESARQNARQPTPLEIGEPLSIREVAAMLGCSAWTVRQRYLPQGLPHLRTGAGGRIVFFREQVIHWILKRQELQKKGGMRK